MHQIAPFKNNFSGKHAPEPPSKRAWVLFSNTMCP